MTRRLPTIHGVNRARCRPLPHGAADLEFSNGERRQFERLRGRGHGAAVVPLLDADTVLLVREYAAGLHRYELGLVKGRIDAGETPLQAADRESEGRSRLRRAPAGGRALAVAGAGVHEPRNHRRARPRPVSERLPGDEPEELEVVPWKLDALGELALREDFSEGRSIAALFAARDRSRRQSDGA